MRTNRASTYLPLFLAALLVLGGLSALAVAKMRSERLSSKLCKTTGGGKFVKMPGFPGEKIDRRLKKDVRFLVRKYKLYVTDGYSLDPVHSPHGEHPRGLALDIVPNKAAGGRWRDVSRLARWAEPTQNQPRPPFRWVGYNGDANHGKGHHLHLSWAHSETKYNRPARTVYTIKCPGKKPGGGGGGGEPDPPKDEGGSTDGTSTGGVRGGRSRRSTGGVRAYRSDRKAFSRSSTRSSAETAGVDG